jgi:hypothetical protein
MPIDGPAAEFVSCSFGAFPSCCTNRVGWRPKAAASSRLQPPAAANASPAGPPWRRRVRHALFEGHRAAAAVIALELSSYCTCFFILLLLLMPVGTTRPGVNCHRIEIRATSCGVQCSEHAQHPPPDVLSGEIPRPYSMQLARGRPGRSAVRECRAQEIEVPQAPALQHCSSSLRPRNHHRQ